MTLGLASAAVILVVLSRVGTKSLFEEDFEFD